MTPVLKIVTRTIGVTRPSRPFLCARVVMASFVCEKCLKNDPSRVDLIWRKCFQRSLHSNEPWVQVKVAERDGVTMAIAPTLAPSLGVSIRPMPKVKFCGKFVQCDGKRCKGKKCTFPHSVEERDAWNTEKFGSKCTSATPTQFYGNWFMFCLCRIFRDNAPS